MLIDFSPSQIMALRDLLVEHLLCPGHTTIYVDAARQIETTPEELLVTVTLAEVQTRAGEIAAGVRQRLQMPSLCVGDLVRVGKASGVNPVGARAVVVEAYTIGDRSGWALLFADGQHDGFSPEDLDLFEVVKIGHEPSVADYQFTSAVRLLADWRAGRFAAVWA
jgi:hypothetical protein